MDADTFFNRNRQNLIDLMDRELGSARVQMTAWIRLRQALEDDFGNVTGFDRVELPFNSRIMEIFQSSDLNEIVNEMFAHMKTQIENPALRNSRFVFDEVLFLDVNFHQLINLTRGSSYISLPDWIGNKKAVINPKNENDEECFKWAVIAGLDHKKIGKDPRRISNLKRFANNYVFSGLKYLVAINEIDKFETKNRIPVNVLGVKGRDIYICKKIKLTKLEGVNLLLITDGENRHYTAVKSLTRLLRSSNSKHKCKQHFCLNCLQGFSLEISRNKHYEYFKDNEAVRIEMPKEGSFVEFHDGQNQFKVPFVMYVDFEAILTPTKGFNFDQNKLYT